MNNSHLLSLEALIGYTFNNKELLQKAITHSSADYNNYEKLEFLGDSLLQIIVTEHIYLHTELKVGEMSGLRSNLVSTVALSNVITKNGFNNYIVFGESFLKNKMVSKNIHADVFESMLAAIYLDGGMAEANKFVHKFLLHNFSSEVVVDYKTRLQEYVQKFHNGTKISYAVLGKLGPSHNVEYEIGIYLNKELKGNAKGKSKKEAEQKCAENLYNSLASEK